MFKKICFIIISIVFLFNLFVISYASVDQSLINVSTKMVLDANYNDVIVNISRNDVKFTQDNEYYYFEISQDLIINAYPPSSSYVSNISSNYVITDTNDMGSLKQLIEEGNSTAYRKEQIYLGWEGGDRRLITNFYRLSNGRIQNDYNYGVYHFRNSTLRYNNNNVTDISYAISSNTSPGNIFNIKSKFGVKKEYIQSLRYFRYIFNRVFAQETSSYRYTGNVLSGITDWSIDLMQYINCEHDFELKEYDENMHHICCKKCEWDRVENHNYNITYDNIENDECICGLRKKVNIIFKNNINDLEIKLQSTPSDIFIKNDINMKGYTFLHFEDKELIDNDWSISTISEIVDLPDIVPKNSHIYNTIYKVHTYKVIYSKENNLNLDFDNEMQGFSIDYNEKKNLDKNEYIKFGYNFIGWAIRPDLENVLFKDEEQIKNLTDVDDGIITLHPVFNRYNFQVHYIDNRYNKNYYKTYSYNINEPLDINTNLSTNDKFHNFRFNNKYIYVKNSNDLLKYITADNQVITLESNYIVDFNEHHIVDNKKNEIISNQEETKKALLNNLPIVDIEDKTKDKKKDNKLNKKNNTKLLNNFNINDDGLVNIFLSSNIRRLKEEEQNKKYSLWEYNYNQIIIKIKKIIENNKMILYLYRFVVVFICLLFLFLLIILIIYIFKKINDNTKNANNY